jgi:competence ComEA-like helix-hairpin-helix protein
MPAGVATVLDAGIGDRPSAARALRRWPGGPASDSLLALQKTVGNKTVAALVARRGGNAAAAGRRLLRDPLKPAPKPLDAVGDYTYLHDPATRKTVVAFRGREWVTISWRRGEPIGVYFDQRESVMEPLGDKQVFADRQVSLRVTSDGVASINVSEAAEDQILGSIPGDTVAIAYDFRVDGELTGIGDGQAHKAPVWRRVEERRPGLPAVGPPQEMPAPPTPKITERLALTQSYEHPDTYRSFGDEKSLRAYLDAHPKLNAAIIQMPDGHFVLRELSEADVRRLAEAARESRSRPESLEDVGRYRGSLARGVFQSLWLGGTRFDSLSELADSYYDDPDLAGYGSAATYRECEVYEMGSRSFGRRALTHADAVARLEQIDKLSRDEVLALESAPGHRFHALWVAGASGRLHTIDGAYLKGRDDFRAKLAAIDGAPDDDARRRQLETGTRAELDYLTAELDRERDNPDVASALRQHSEYTRNLELLFYTEVRDWAQGEATEILLRSGAQVRSIVEDERKISALVEGFSQLSAEAQRQSLVFLGVPPDEVGAWLAFLRDPRTALELAYGHTIQFDQITLSLERLQALARKNMDGVDALADQLRKGTIDAIKIQGPFGDDIRTRAYRWFGFKTLAPGAFPHKDRVPETWPGPLTGRRADFSSLGEQLFANQARWFGAMDTLESTLEKIAIATAIIVPTVVLMLAFNVAGLAIAEAAFGLAEGTLGWFVVGGAIGGTLAGAAEVGLKAALGADIGGAGGALGTVLEGAAGGAFFGGLGRLMKGVGAGWRITGMGMAFLSTSAGVQRLKTGKWPWEGTTEELAFWFYENALSFALMEAGSVVARPLTQRVGIWSRMQRLGVMPEAKAAFVADATRLNRDLAAFVVRPQRADAEAAALEKRYTDLLQRQRTLVQEAATVIRGQERSAALELELQAELSAVDGQLRSMRAVRFLADLKVKPVGETQTAFEYQPGPDSKTKIQQFYVGADVKEEDGGVITVKLAGEKHPLIFIPAGSAAPTVTAPLTPATPRKVNINTATAKQLAEEVPGVGPKLAEKIVTERTVRGGFNSVDDLQSVLPPTTFAKAAPVLTTTGPPTVPLQQRLLDLEARRGAIVERSKRTGVSDPTIDRAREMNIGSRRNEKALAEADAVIAAAEKVGGTKIDAAAKQAYKSRAAAKGVGTEGMDAAQADALSAMGETQVGEALLPFKGLRGLTPAAMRGALHAHRAKVPVRGFVEVSKGMPVAERNFALETYGRLKDARVAGADKVLFDMGGGRGKWVGGMWAFEYARFDAGIERIAQLEMRVEVDGVVREVDVVLKDGTNVELKNWGEWETKKEKFLFQFEKDVRQGRFAPELFKKQRYVFREPAPAALSAIRAEMRQRLTSVLRTEVDAARVTNARAQELLAAFDAESGLVATSPVRHVGAPDVPPPTQGTPVPLPSTVDDDAEKKKTEENAPRVPAGVP